MEYTEFGNLPPMQQFTFVGGEIKMFRAEGYAKGIPFNALYVEDGQPLSIANESKVIPLHFWVCSEIYSGSGRLSRTWIAQAPVSPDTPEECTGQNSVCHDERAYTQHANSHIAYPFNGMGGQVEGGPFITRDEADIFQTSLWPKDD